MNRKIFAVAFLFAASIGMGAYADEGRDRAAFGFSVGERAGDFSLGLEAASPTVVHGFLGLRAGAEILWKEAVAIGGAAEDSRPYSLYRLGVQATGAELKDMRLYGELGAVALIPPEQTLEELRFGIYGVWGFEFFIRNFPRLCYFIELGATGTFGATDELAVGEPLLANGFAARAGLRLRL